MTNPSPISKYAPNNNGGSGERTEFTDKKDLVDIPLVITTARSVRGKQGAFWIIEADRQDTGDHVVFTGSTVIDQTMTAVKDQNAFPVAAMLVKVQPDDPSANWYWNLVDPPGTTAAAEPSAARSRIEEVKALIDELNLPVSAVADQCAEIAGEGKKVNDLDDGQYEVLLTRLRTTEPPF